MVLITELTDFSLSDAVKFHDELNPALWNDDQLDPEVREQLIVIAKDFLQELGVSQLDVDDITISGSNAAFSYTPHSDLDLHILVDFSNLSNDEVYQELFTAKKTLYNDSHDITVHGVPVELYVQDVKKPVRSLGEYSVLNNEWIHFPKKSKANLDHKETKAKFEKLAKLIELTLKSKDLDKVNDAISLVKRYRQAGLDKGGEFSPENLSYKALRTQGGITALYSLRDKLHSKSLSIEEADQLDKPTLTVHELAKKHSVPVNQLIQQLNKGIRVELEHTTNKQVAKEIALDHLKEFPNYYDRLAKAETNESASGYIPSEKEKNDPRFKTALTVDIKPDTLRKNAKAFGFKVSRAGIPPLLRK
jgi:hypothetical protein